MKTVVVIPARGGSKGIPGKNIKKLGGKPLIQYTIDAARRVFNDDQIIVSTDDPKIKEIVEDLGLKVPFLRPESLATDTAGSHEVLLHVIDYLTSQGYFPEVLVLLQPTSPFRNQEHIEAAIDIFNEKEDLEMLVSVMKTKSNPYYVLFEENEDGFLQKSKNGDFNRRQDAPEVWEINGAIYIIRISDLKKAHISSFKRIYKYEMDEVSSLDIDSELDWLLAEKLIQSYTP